MEQRSTNRNRLLLRAATTGTLLLGMLVALSLVQAGPIIGAGSLNISRAQYDAAVARWDGLHAAEYSETVRFAGRWEMVVSVSRTATATAETVTQFSSLDPPYIGSGSQRAINPADITVGAALRRIDGLLQLHERLAADGWLEDPGSNPAFDVSFDPALGFPRSITARLFSDLRGPVRHAGDDDLTIEDVKVLK